MSEPVQGSAAPTSEAAPSTSVQPDSSGSTQSTPVAQQLQDVVENGTPKEVAAAKKMLKQLSYKVDGKEYSEDLPFEIPEDQADYMRKQLSMNKGAAKRMEHSAQLEKEVKEFVGQLKGNTKETLARMGIDPKEFAAAMLEEELRQSQMSPEQKELEELKAKLKAAEDEKKKNEEEFTAKELERATQAEYERISTRMEKAIASSGLPQDPAIVKRMANYMLIGNQMGVKLDPEDVVEVVREDMFKEIQGLVQALGADKVEGLIGKDILNQIRKKNVAKAKSPTPATAKAGIKDIGAKTKEEKSTAPKKSFKDHFGF